AIALRERVDRLVEHRVEKAQLDHALHGFPARLAFEPAQLGGKIEKALHRHVWIGGGVLGQVADQALRLERRFDDIVAADRDAAGAGRHEPRDHAHGGRLPRAVRAEEAEHFAALDGEGRSEEHTSEPQSPCKLVCRVLLAKKKTLQDECIAKPLCLLLVAAFVNLELSHLRRLVLVYFYSGAQRLFRHSLAYVLRIWVTILS